MKIPDVNKNETKINLKRRQELFSSKFIFVNYLRGPTIRHSTETKRVFTGAPINIDDVTPGIEIYLTLKQEVFGLRYKCSSWSDRDWSDDGIKTTSQSSDVTVEREVKCVTKHLSEFTVVAGE